MTLYPASPDGLNNINIGGPENHRVGAAFKAHFDSPLAAIRFYLMTAGAGYAGGTGGKLKYELYADVGGVPAAATTAPASTTAPAAQRVQLYQDNNGVPGSLFFSGWMGSAPAPAPAPAPSVGPIASGVLLVDKQYTEWLNAGGFPLIGFPTHPLLTKGSWYHFVISNVDPQPAVNFSSFNAMMAKGGVNPDPDSFIEYSDASGKTNWTKYNSMVLEPFGVFYATGDCQGNGGYQLASDGSMMCGKEYGFGRLC